jgi:predicted PurR-regulated permease PerM
MIWGLKKQAIFWLAAIAVFFAAVALFRAILLPFVAGMAVAYLLDPVCDRLERAGLSRTWATTVVTLVFLLLVVLAGLLLVPLLVGQVSDLIERLPAYLEVLRDQISAILASLETRLSPETLARVRATLAESSGRMVSIATGFLGDLISGGVALANLLSLIFITPVVSFYLLRDWDVLVGRIDGWLPRASAGTARAQMRLIDRTLAGWVRGQFTVCLLLAAFYAIALTIAGLDFGLVIGLVAGLLSFVPFVGAAAGLLGAVGLAIVQFDDWVRIAVVAAIFLVGQMLEGNLLTPRLVGDRVGLHPVWVIFALLAGGALFGFVGILLAVPVAAALGVLIRFLLERYLESEVYGGGEAPCAPDDPGP